MSAIVGTPRVEIGAVVMTQPKQLKPELEEIVRDLIALREMAKDGILTHHSQRELVRHLNPRDLADVARAVSLMEKRQQPIYNRTK
jgi:hypothetical protein